MVNQYPLWKYILMLALFVLGLIYALPNLFHDDPAVQISAKNTAQITTDTLTQISSVLQSKSISYLNIARDGDDVLVRFPDTDTQLQASDILHTALGDNYVVALNLAPRTPKWLQAIGAHPMKLGLDLRGGVHFLLDVDTDAVMKARQQGDIGNMGQQLRGQDIRYSSIALQGPNAIVLQFRDQANADKAKDYLDRNFPDYVFTKTNPTTLTAAMNLPAVNKVNEYAMQQTMTILRNRVNELGVSEAIVQQQGSSQISVDLPGIQDTARAKDLIGKTATLRFQLVDTTHDVQSAVAGSVPFGSRLYQFNGQPILLLDNVILRGDSITYATAAFGQDGRPSVQVRLGGGGESYFAQQTAANIGKPLAVIYVETETQNQMVNGKSVMTQKQVERVINVATIQSALNNSFEITGLDSQKYAQNLSLLLRSGALVAPVSFAQERTLGPSLGKANIHKGVRSVVVGALCVIIFMAFYYRLFGLVADITLIFNIIFMVAILSILGATLTLPGIAGIVLTVGIAVDANVLINERIREELRNGMSPQASIATGYSRAFATIVDANVTTLIVAMVLFALGSDAVKSFAITLTIGILTSMVTAIFFTRGIVNLIYGSRSVKTLSIGIKHGILQNPN